MRKILRKSASAMIVILSFLLVAISFYGIKTADNYELRIRFIETVIRSMSILVFLVIYNSYLSSSTGSDTVFIPAYMLFSMIPEFRVLDKFGTSLFGLPLSAYIITRIISCGAICMTMCLLGYGLFYRSHDYGKSISFLFESFAGSLIISFSIPVAKTYSNIYTSFYLHIILALLSLCVTIVFIMLIIKDSRKNIIPRHLSIIVLCLGDFLSLYYDSFWMNILGTILFLAGLIGIMGFTHVADTTF